MSPPQEVVERSSGTVKHFIPNKGFGFIAPDDGGPELFVHQSSIRSDGFRTLAREEKVEFSTGFRQNGSMQAIDVTGPNGAALQGSKRVRTVAREGSGGERRVRCYNCDGEHLQRNCTQGGGSGGRGGNGNDGGCYNCHGVGHIARDCPSAENVGRRGGRAGGGCYNCREEGHIARDCPQQRSYGGGCYNCREEGHIARDCFQQRSYGGRSGGGCYTCGEEGHMARECAQGNNNCYTCKKPGHFARECPMASA